LPGSSLPVLLLRGDGGVDQSIKDLIDRLANHHLGFRNWIVLGCGHARFLPQEGIDTNKIHAAAARPEQCLLP
jgi:uncharacterized alpha/beta hydrolase family protein